MLEHKGLRHFDLQKWAIAHLSKKQWNETDNVSECSDDQKIFQNSLDNLNIDPKWCWRCSDCNAVNNLKISKEKANLMFYCCNCCIYPGWKFIPTHTN